MSWGLAIALGMAALLALAHAVHTSLIRLYRLEEFLLAGRGLSPSLLLAYPLAHEEGRAR